MLPLDINHTSPYNAREDYLHIPAHLLSYLIILQLIHFSEIFWTAYYSSCGTYSHWLDYYHKSIMSHLSLLHLIFGMLPMKVRLTLTQGRSYNMFLSLRPSFTCDKRAGFEQGLITINALPLHHTNPTGLQPNGECSGDSCLSYSCFCYSLFLGSTLRPMS